MNEYKKINIIFSSTSKSGFDNEYEIETDSKICEVTDYDWLGEECEVEHNGTSN